MEAGTEIDQVAQVGGDHYGKVPGEQHWDRVARLNLNYFQGTATAYIERAFLKGNAVEDLLKAASYCNKLVKLIEAGTVQVFHPADPHYDHQNPKRRPGNTLTNGAVAAHTQPNEDKNAKGT